MILNCHASICRAYDRWKKYVALAFTCPPKYNKNWLVQVHKNIFLCSVSAELKFCRFLGSTLNPCNCFKYLVVKEYKSSFFCPLPSSPSGALLGRYFWMTPWLDSFTCILYIKNTCLLRYFIIEYWWPPSSIWYTKRETCWITWELIHGNLSIMWSWVSPYFMCFCLFQLLYLWCFCLPHVLFSYSNYDHGIL